MTFLPLAREFTGYGGGDFCPTHYFIEEVHGEPDGVKYSIDVYTAVDMGHGWHASPSQRPCGKHVGGCAKSARHFSKNKWRSDNHSSNPKISHGSDLLPCTPDGGWEYADDVYDEIRRNWLCMHGKELSP